MKRNDLSLSKLKLSTQKYKATLTKAVFLCFLFHSINTQYTYDSKHAFAVDPTGDRQIDTIVLQDGNAYPGTPENVVTSSGTTSAAQISVHMIDATSGSIVVTEPKHWDLSASFSSDVISIVTPLASNFFYICGASGVDEITVKFDITATPPALEFTHTDADNYKTLALALWDLSST